MELCLADTAGSSAAPRRGTRRTTAALLAAEALAADFAGLPAGVTRWTVMRTLRLAAQALGLSARELQLLEVYIENTFDADWAAGGEPIVITPVVELAEALGVTERQVRNIEHALLCRGLITFRDCGNHLRRGRRDVRTGKLLHGYGPSLAPMGARFAEIDALGARAAQERLAARQARLAITALRRRIRADIDALRDAGRTVEAASAAESLGREPRRLAAATPVTELERRRARLKVLASSLAIILGGEPIAPTTGSTSARAEIDGQPHIQRPSREFLKEGSASKIAVRVDSGGSTSTAPRAPAIGTRRDMDPATAEVPQRASEDDADLKGESIPTQGRSAGLADRPRHTHGLERVPLDVIAATMPERFKTYLDPQRPLTWSTLVDAAIPVCRELRISAAEWGEACHVIGRNAAAISVLLVDARTPASGGKGGVGNPAAYLRAMTICGKEGRLRLDASVFALAGHRRRKSPPGRRDRGERSQGAGSLAGAPHAKRLSDDPAVYS